MGELIEYGRARDAQISAAERMAAERRELSRHRAVQFVEIMNDHAVPMIRFYRRARITEELIRRPGSFRRETVEVHQFETFGYGWPVKETNDGYPKCTAVIETEGGVETYGCTTFNPNCQRFTGIDPSRPYMVIEPSERGHQPEVFSAYNSMQVLDDAVRELTQRGPR